MTTSVGGRFGTLTALTLGILLLSAPMAGASCAPPIAIEEAMEQAPVVFVGTVMTLEHDGRFAGFSVEEVWKGQVDSKVVVSGGPTPSDLEGLTFGESVVTSVDRFYEEGVTYLVVPFGIDEGVYMDNACSVTQVYDASLDDFRPATAHAPADVGTANDLLVARVAIGVIVALGAAGVIVGSMLRRRAIGHSQEEGSLSVQ